MAGRPCAMVSGGDVASDEASAVAVRGARAPGDRAARPEPDGRVLDARVRGRPSAGGLPRPEVTRRRRGRRSAGSARAAAGWAPNASAAPGVVLAADGTLVEAEHELAAAERFFTDEVATLHHTWLLVLLARVRPRCGRLTDADATLGSARGARRAQRQQTHSRARRQGATGARRASDRASSGELLEPASDAEVAVLTLLAGDLSVREIAERLSLSQNTIRSHTRALYRKLGVHTRSPLPVIASTVVGGTGRVRRGRLAEPRRRR
jgi:DNA-binding CsgD family transcriptional regulator